VTTDDQIQAEIRAQIKAGALPPPDANTIYAVFTSEGVVVRGSDGSTSENAFLAYHEYSYAADSSFSDTGDSQEGNFAYMVVPTEKDQRTAGVVKKYTPHLETVGISHELAEAVTDPEPGLQALGQGGWFDAVGRNGEIGDVPVYLYDDGRIPAQDLYDVLEVAGGRRYLVQKEWSNQDGKPEAFAPK